MTPPQNSKVLTICFLLLILNVFGIYGALFSSFYPSDITEAVAGWASLLFFILFSAYFISLAFKNKITVRKKFVGYRFFIFTFLGIPLLVGYATLLFLNSASRGIPDLLNFAFVEEKSSTVKVYDKRVWGKHDNRYELYISGYDRGAPVSKSTYTSIDKGQALEIHISRSVLGARVRL